MARVFRGESTHKVDGKGRVSIPASFRRALEKNDPDWKEGLLPQFVIVYGWVKKKKCLLCFSMAEMERIDRKIASMERFTKLRDAFHRLFHTQSVEATVDDTGRIVLSQRLRELIGITGEAVFAGMGEHFEIWENDAYRADQARLEEAIDEELGEDGDLLALLDTFSRS